MLEKKSGSCLEWDSERLFELAGIIFILIALLFLYLYPSVVVPETKRTCELSYGDIGKMVRICGRVEWWERRGNIFFVLRDECGKIRGVWFFGEPLGEVECLCGILGRYKGLSLRVMWRC